MPHKVHAKKPADDSHEGNLDIMGGKDGFESPFDGIINRKVDKIINIESNGKRFIIQSGRMGRCQWDTVKKTGVHPNLVSSIYKRYKLKEKIKIRLIV